MRAITLRAKRWASATLILATLAACTSDDLQNAALGGMKGWCRNTPDRCTVHDERP